MTHDHDQDTTDEYAHALTTRVHVHAGRPSSTQASPRPDLIESLARRLTFTRPRLAVRALGHRSLSTGRGDNAACDGTTSPASKGSPRAGQQGGRADRPLSRGHREGAAAAYLAHAHVGHLNREDQTP